MGLLPCYLDPLDHARLLGCGSLILEVDLNRQCLTDGLDKGSKEKGFTRTV